MKKKSRRATVVGIWLVVALCSLSDAQTQSGTSSTVKKETNRMTHASGEFEVKMTPQPADDKTAGAAIGRFTIDKEFHGDLEGTSKGEMLAVMAVEGSAGYVAMEQVTGKLNGRSGTFALQHTGTMTRGTPQLSVSVVPDSGTGELKGLSGHMTIKIDGPKHFYEFEYTMPENP
jgi:hypothetical protein